MDNSHNESFEATESSKGTELRSNSSDVKSADLLKSRIQFGSTIEGNTKQLRSRCKNETGMNVGDDVLCYEPDPNRKKLLYEAKILDKFLKDDGAGNKTEYYRVHFHGWRNVWDRDVTSKYVLKDISENRRLKTYLERQAYGEKYTGQETSDRSRIFEGGRKSNLTPLTRDTEQNKEMSSSEGDVVKLVVKPECSSDAAESKKERDIFEFDNKFQYLTARDEFFIKDRKMLVDVPVVPNVISVLYHYLVHYVTHDLKDYMYKNPGSTCNFLSNRVQLCKEFVDNIRTCFDAILANVLLFEEERVQFELISLAMDIEENPTNTYEIESLIPRSSMIRVGVDSVNDNSSSDYDDDTMEGQCSYNRENSRNSSQSKHFLNKSRRTRSRNNVQRKHSQSMSKSRTRPPNMDESSRYGLRDKGCNIYDRYMKTLFSTEVLDWNVVPTIMVYHQPHLPSFVYGAIHLARFLVILPKIASKCFTEPKTGPILLNFFHSLQRFLYEHEEWFGKEYYLPADDAEQLPKLMAESNNCHVDDTS